MKETDTFDLVMKAQCGDQESMNQIIKFFILDGANATQMNVPASGYSYIGSSAWRKLPAMIQVVNNVQL